jgi:hypothetical protein
MNIAQYKFYVVVQTKRVQFSTAAIEMNWHEVLKACSVCVCVRVCARVWM